MIAFPRIPDANDNGGTARHDARPIHILAIHRHAEAFALLREISDRPHMQKLTNEEPKVGDAELSSCYLVFSSLASFTRK